MLIVINVNFRLFLGLKLVVKLPDHDFLNEIFQFLVIKLFSCDQFNDSGVDQVKLFWAEYWNYLVVSLLKKFMGDDWRLFIEFMAVDVIDQ